MPNEKGQTGPVGSMAGSASGFLPLTTASVLALASIGPYSWNPAPAPKKGPLFVRNKGSAHHTIHDDNWLLKEIHGDDYEWSLPNT